MGERQRRKSGGQISPCRLPLARRADVRIDLLPRCGDIPITAISEHDLNEWVREFRVKDREATVAKYGRQQRSETRQVVYKTPLISTLGNIDWAFASFGTKRLSTVWWIGAIARSSTNR